jgi:hypothetical protein
MIVSLKAGDWIQVELPSGARINIEVTADYSMTTRQDGKVLYHEIKENEQWTEEDQNGTHLLIASAKPRTASSAAETSKA